MSDFRIGDRVRLKGNGQVGQIVRKLSPRVHPYTFELWVIVRWDGHYADQAHKLSDVAKEQDNAL